MFAGLERRYAAVEVIERDREVPRVPAGGLESESGCEEGADAHQRQDLEADQRRLLCQLVDGGIAGSEHRDAVLAVDRVISVGVCPDDVRVEVATPDDNGVVVIEMITRSDVPLLRQALPFLPVSRERIRRSAGRA
ncbi:MAG: hypothetical protein JJU45_12045 [Acidimicrobiia bacterium]|nr:hypothetical protein [Acidimicrobiia bacterium]